MLSTVGLFNPILEIGRWFLQAVQTQTIRSYLGERKR